MLESLSNKVAGLKAGNFMKKRIQGMCFAVNIDQFLRATFSLEHLRVAVFVSLMKAVE